MKTIAFSGNSDDLVHVEGGPKKYDEVNSSDQVVFVVGGKVRVVVYYGDNGTWGVGLSQWDEDIEFPDWPTRFVQQSDTPYSVRLELDVPDDVSVVRET